MSAGLAYTFLAAAVSRVNVYGVDALIAIPAISFVFTLVAVGGVAAGVGGGPDADAGNR
jgi:hypothetical protein